MLAHSLCLQWPHCTDVGGHASSADGIHWVCVFLSHENIHRYPMSPTSLECQVSDWTIVTRAHVPRQVYSGGAAFTTKVAFEGGANKTFSRRERPELMMDAAGRPA
jgi:hypothetical protein